MIRRRTGIRSSACAYELSAERTALVCEAPGHDRHRVILANSARRSAVLRELADRGALADGAAREEADAAVALAASQGRLG